MALPRNSEDQSSIGKTGRVGTELRKGAMSVAGRLDPDKHPDTISHIEWKMRNFPQQNRGDPGTGTRAYDSSYVKTETGNSLLQEYSCYIARSGPAKGAW